MTKTFQTLHESALANYNAGCRNPACILDQDGIATLAASGVSLQFLYDAVDDLVRYGEPSQDVFIELASIRSEHFEKVLQRQTALKIIEESELPPKAVEFEGVAWLARIIRKALCFLEGSLCDEIMYGCAGDRAFLKKFDTTLPVFLRVVRDADGDPARVLQFLQSNRS